MHHDRKEADALAFVFEMIGRAAMGSTRRYSSSCCRRHSQGQILSYDQTAFAVLPRSEQGGSVKWLQIRRLDLKDCP